MALRVGRLSARDLRPSCAGTDRPTVEVEEVTMPAVRRRPEPRCPIRLGETCSLCVPGASGPEDCGLVYLVMQDEDLRAELARMRADPARSGTSR